ncbi:hypothetical protein KTQ42_13690|uniref:hypothetical protein n=1 Tax=Noviherbaspirillum sp. L7-7A TaxID=2850560 RepID=UPI001C2C244F|nr:hypothetical protein [Noviherbaspirillum sp. L7-7A]MBV0880359.1 hypothetical protein [Noviherbaspirillum sp. L7-7A]
MSQIYCSKEWLPSFADGGLRVSGQAQSSSPALLCERKQWKGAGRNWTGGAFSNRLLSRPRYQRIAAHFHAFRPIPMSQARSFVWQQ